ncbi:MAG TPA: hypothetical protein ENK57_04290 [Polyangiaceae bacterium]|nr:hypothetical protein [Polyangiaceae bacterium]
MNDPRRMLEGAAADELEIELLRAGKSEEPSSRARERAMAAAGLTSAVAASSLAAAVATEASLPPAAAKVGASAAGLVVKWVGLAALGGIGLWGAWKVAEPVPSFGVASAGLSDSFAAAADRAVVDGSSAVAPAPDARDDDAQQNGEQDAQSQERAAESEADEAPVEQSTPRPVAVAPRASGLVQEVEAIDRARAALKDDPEAALVELEAYRRDFSGGILAQEAEVLRIESLARAGRAEQAQRAATAFLATHPDSPLASRVRAALAAP